MSSDQSGAGDSRGADGTGDGLDVRDLLGAYALDAVDDLDRRAVDRLVARDPEAARELAGLTATAAMLGSAVASPPPPGLRDAVLREIARTTQLPADPAARRPASARTGAPVAATSPVRASSPATEGPTRRASVPRRTVWLAVAATALGAAAIPGTLAWQQAQQTQRVEQQVQAFADLLADPSAVVVRAEVTGGGAAVGVLAADQALFTATGLDEPDEGKAYQLWVVRDGAARSVEVLADDDGRVRAIADDFAPGDALAVTIEPAAGSVQPTTDPIVLLSPA